MLRCLQRENLSGGGGGRAFGVFNSASSDAVKSARQHSE